MSSVTKSSSSHSDEEVELRRGPWTVEEDSMLIQYIASHGEGHWNLLAKRSGLRRTGKSCRLRWLNYLKPDVKRGDLTPQEQLLILELHSKLGNRWSKIAQHLPGRTDNEIKNYWRTRVQKQARNLKIDSNSTAFQEVIRCLWIPRLLQKIHGSSPSATTRPLNLEPPIPLNKSTLTYSLELDHQHQKNSGSENCSSPSIDSSLDQSMHISSIPQISEYPTSPFGAMGGYDVDDTNSFGMEPFSLTPPMGDFRDPIDDRHLVQSNWINDDAMADSLWNMDELWQFRQL